jgi:hypothetical protein
MHHIFIADQSAARDERQSTSVAGDCDALEFVAPRTWVAKAKPRPCESSCDLHHELDVSEDEPTAADRSAEVVATATEGPQVEICNAWDSMLHWYACLATEPLTTRLDGLSANEHS